MAANYVKDHLAAIKDHKLIAWQENYHKLCFDDVFGMGARTGHTEFPAP
jgi:hypothetical protein